MILTRLFSSLDNLLKINNIKEKEAITKDQFSCFDY